MTRKSPKIASLNRDVAAANIKRKLAILRAWLAKEIPALAPGDGDVAPRQQVTLDYFPRSLRQFNNWDGTQNCATTRAGLPPILRNANETLRKHQSLRTELERLLSALSLRAAEQSAALKPHRISKLIAELKVERARRSLLEREVVELRRHLKAELARLTQELQVKNSINHELQSLVGNLRSDNEALTARNADLAHTLSRVVPLRRASDDD